MLLLLGQSYLTVFLGTFYDSLSLHNNGTINKNRRKVYTTVIMLFPTDPIKFSEKYDLLPPGTALPRLSLNCSTSMNLIPTDQTIRALIHNVDPEIVVDKLAPLPSARLQMLYNVTTKDGDGCLLALPPPSHFIILRGEHSIIEGEARILQWLSNLVHEKDTSGNAAMEGVPLPKEDATQANNTIQELSDFVPRLISHGSSPELNGAVYNLIRPSDLGVTIPSLSPSITDLERAQISYQAGQLLRRACKLVSPTATFGPASEILFDNVTTPTGACHVTKQEASTSGSGVAMAKMAGSAVPSVRGNARWSVAMRTLMEAALRDAEDLSLMVPYSSIRRQFEKYIPILDQVTHPRLVVLNIHDENNIMVTREPQGREDVEPDSRSTRSSSSESGSTEKEASAEDEVQVSSIETASSSPPPSDGETEDNSGDITITGLRDWSSCIFGDLLLASGFQSTNSNKHFSRGFHGSSQNDQESLPSPPYSSSSSPPPGLDLENTTSCIDNAENSYIRLLLYGCYHAVRSLVQEFARPSADREAKELVARKSLTEGLARLAALDERGRVVRVARERPEGGSRRRRGRDLTRGSARALTMK